jgi:hypothetical protein
MITYDWQLVLDHRWENVFNELLKYGKLYGTLNVPHRFKKEESTDWERKLANWVFTQRRKLRIGELELWRYEKLISVGFDFEPHDSHFEEKYTEFLEFQKRFGHPLVPYACKEYPSLYSWISHLRRRPLSDERRKRLNDAGFVWSYISERWQIRFRELVDYKNKFGHFVIPLKLNEYNELRIWTQKMRSKKINKKRKILSADKIKLLDSIGFTWDPELVRWENNFNNLVQFKAENGHCHPLIKNNRFEGLGNWIVRLRKYKHKLTIEQIAKIDSLGFEWDTYKALRERNKLKKKML